jgi:SP family general alpha glucoside:H+ symporter-like MFS transporter
LSNGALVGEVLGLMMIGYIVERVGYKKTMIGSLALLTGFIFIVFFAQSLPMLLVGEILMGIPWSVSRRSKDMKDSALTYSTGVPSRP